MEIKSYGKSDVGRVRSGNEDYFAIEYISKDENLFIVADGMGGHKAGNIASRLGTKTFISEFKKNREKKITVSKSMLISLREANKKILEEANSDIDKRGMGTTFSALLFKGDKAEIIHVGDSRIYLIRNNKMERVTTDHTFVEKMREEGRITEAEARRHPQKNILYMSLGARESFNPYIKKDFKIKDGDIFLLCSDGLTDMVEDQVIKEYCLSYSPKKTAEELIELSNRNGGIDNITVLNIHVGNTDKDDMTHPIKIETKQQKKIPFLKLLTLFFFIVILFLLVKTFLLKPTEKQDIRIIFSQFDLAELKNSNIDISGEKSDKELQLVKGSENPLFSKKNGKYSLLFFKEFYIIESGTGKKIKKYYFHFGKRLKFEKIFFVNSLNTIAGIDDMNKVYKFGIKL